MIPLETQRLRLRAVGEGDLGFVVRLHANADLLRFIPPAATPDASAARRLLERFTELVCHPVQGFSLIELRQTGQAVGLIMVKPIPPADGTEPSVLEIGWRQVAEHCGHGYVTEAAAAVLEAVHDRGVKELVAVTHPDNLASQRVAERIGMERIGTNRDYYDAAPQVLFRSCRRPAARHAWLPEGWELLPAGEYAFPGPLRDRLVGAILAGEKTATTALAAEYEAQHAPLPQVGSREVVVDSAGAPICVTELTGVAVVPLGEVTDEHAVAEGEGWATAGQWRQAHERFWSSPQYLTWFDGLGAPPPVLDDDAPVVCTRLRVLTAAPAVAGSA